MLSQSVNSRSECINVPYKQILTQAKETKLESNIADTFFTAVTNDRNAEESSTYNTKQTCKHRWALAGTWCFFYGCGIWIPSKCRLHFGFISLFLFCWHVIYIFVARQKEMWPAYAAFLWRSQCKLPIVLPSGSPHRSHDWKLSILLTPF